MKNVKSTRTVEGKASSRLYRHARNAILLTGFLPTTVFAQTAFTWQQIKDNFAAMNPTLKSGAA
jgi:hypothetical protein